MKHKAVIYFFVTLALCSALISIGVVNRMNVEQLTMENLISEKTAKANDVLSRLLYKTETIAAIIKKNGGDVSSFDVMASTILDDPAIQNVLIAPGGVVSDVYPLRGNEAVLGLDYFAEGYGNREAMLAVETRNLVFGGPFDAVQGGQILVGRLPVYLNTPEGETFWGIVSVTLKYPQALDGAGLSELNIQGFAYEIWRMNPDTDERQIILGSDYTYNKNSRYIEKSVSIVNTEWFFRIMPVRDWYQFPETWALVFFSLCVSFLAAFVLQNNLSLKALKAELEVMAHTDSLTGIANRRYFTDIVEKQLSRSKQDSGVSFVVIFDLDNFKAINDRHGHKAGDLVLKSVASCIKDQLRAYDLFARYGGEEFIIFITGIGKESALAVVERLRASIAKTDIDFEGETLSVTASFGIAMVEPLGDLDAATQLADSALYTAKHEGRNRVVFAEQSN